MNARKESIFLYFEKLQQLSHIVKPVMSVLQNFLIEETYGAKDEDKFSGRTKEEKNK